MTETEIYEYRIKQQIELVFEQLKVLKPFLDDSSLTDIMVNQNGQIFTDGIHGMNPTKTYVDEQVKNRIAALIASYNKKEITEETPILSGKLPSGERIEIVTGEATGFRSTISIRKPNKRIFTLDEYVEIGSMRKEQKEYLENAVKEAKNIVIFGGTGTGKTTIINSLIKILKGTSERIAVVEEVPELIINPEEIQNLLRYTTTVHVSSSKILKYLMRQRPDRIIFGELRWGEETETLLDGWNTGHKGGMTSNHANSAKDGIHRLEELLTEVPGKSESRPYMVARGVNVAIHIRRERSANGWRRFIDEILEIEGYDKNLQEYIYKEIV